MAQYGHKKDPDGFCIAPDYSCVVTWEADGKLLAVRDEERLVIYQTTGEQKTDLSLVGLMPKKADYCDNRPIRSPYLSVSIVHQFSF